MFSMNKTAEKIIKWGSLGMFIACSLTILIGASLDGDISENRSGIITDFINQIIDDHHDRETIKEIEGFDISFENDETNKIYYVGDTLSYSVRYSPIDTSYKALEWTIDDPSILEIDQNECKLSFLKEGSTTIHVASERRNDLKRSFSFAVKNIQVEQIGLDLTTLAVNKGDSYQLSPIILPENATNKDLIFSSSSDVLKINSLGIFQAQKEGNATITITSVDNPKIPKTINVNVLESSKTDYVPVDPSLFELSLSESKKANDYNSPYDDFSKIPLGCELNVSSITNEDATNKDIYVNVEDSDVLLYDKERKVLSSKKKGSTKIFVTSQDNIDIVLEKQIEVFDTSSPFTLDLEKISPLSSKIDFKAENELDHYEIHLDYGKSYRLYLKTLVECTSSSITYERLEKSQDQNIVYIDGSGNITTSSIGEEFYRITYGEFQTYSLDVSFVVERSSLFTWSQLNVIMRKSLGHFGLFAITSVFACIFISMSISKYRYRLMATCTSLIVGFSLAGFSELIQLYTPGRTCSWIDVGIDTLGYFLSIIIYLIVLLVIWLVTRKRLDKRN